MNRYDILDALNSVDVEQIEATGRFFENGKERVPMKRAGKIMRVFLVAAALTALLSVTAYAAGFFNMKGRETQEGEEFPVSFTYDDGDVVSGAWTGTYALEFDGPETCQPVRYRFGWLPEDIADSRHDNRDADGWVKRWDWEEGTTTIPWSEHVDLSNGERETFFIADMYYAPQFANGGALILLNAEIEDVEEESWDELSIRKIRSVWRYLEEDENGILKKDEKGRNIVFEKDCNYVVLFHPEQGWIFAIRGTFPMEDLVKIAENLEVEQTEGLVEPSQFQNPYDFFDAGRG